MRSSDWSSDVCSSDLLFIAMHRARFADRVLAELRGVIDERGGSPFWDGVAGRFFGMGFQDADYFNAINGNKFIAALRSEARRVGKEGVSQGRTRGARCPVTNK